MMPRYLLPLRGKTDNVRFSSKAEALDHVGYELVEARLEPNGTGDAGTVHSSDEH